MRALFVSVILSCLIPGFMLYLEGMPCKTPDLLNGRCTKLNYCPTIYNPYTRPGYIHHAHWQCGQAYSGYSHLVCCHPKQRPPVDAIALHKAERCIDSEKRRGVCIPRIACESLYIENRIMFPRKTYECILGSNEICCPTWKREGEAAIQDNSIRFPTLEEGCGETFRKARVKRIVGGETSKIGNWPWVALLGYSNRMETTFSCGGVLITDRHVLTAAHCLKKELQFVRLGEHDLSTNEEAEHIDIRVSEYFPHPQYTLIDRLYDIAILHLHTPVTFTQFVSPICLPLTPELQRLPYKNAQPYVTGWGRSHENGTGTTILQNIQVQTYDNSVCKHLYKKKNAIMSDKQFSEVVLCAGDMNGVKDACKGDSGGPIMMPVQYGDGKRFVLIGLVSYGIGCGRKDVLSVNTNVMNLMPWIKDSVAKMH